MRVTTFGTTAQYLNDLNNIMSKFQNLEQQLSTGRKLNQPSDDPVAFEADINTQAALTQSNQWRDNVNSATTKMQTADSTISTLQDVLGKIRTQLLQATTGSNTPSDVGSIAAVVTQEIREVAQVANTTDGNQYIFSGANGKALPISLGSTTNPVTGDTIDQLTWQAGNTPDQQTTIGDNVKVSVSVSGQSIFNTPPSGGSGAPSLIDTLNKINADLNTAVKSPDVGTFGNNLKTLQSDIGALDSNIDNITTQRSDLGGRMDRMDAAKTQLDQTVTNLTTKKGSVEGADLAQVLTQLSTQQTVYQAALASGQRMVLPTLADVLK